MSDSLYYLILQRKEGKHEKSRKADVGYFHSQTTQNEAHEVKHSLSFEAQDLFDLKKYLVIANYNDSGYLLFFLLKYSYYWTSFFFPKRLTTIKLKIIFLKQKYGIICDYSLRFTADKKKKSCFPIHCDDT